MFTNQVPVSIDLIKTTSLWLTWLGKTLIHVYVQILSDRQNIEQSICKEKKFLSIYTNQVFVTNGRTQRKYMRISHVLHQKLSINIGPSVTEVLTLMFLLILIQTWTTSGGRKPSVVVHCIIKTCSPFTVLLLERCPDTSGPLTFQSLLKGFLNVVKKSIY